VLVVDVQYDCAGDTPLQHWTADQYEADEEAERFTASPASSVSSN